MAAAAVVSAASFTPAVVVSAPIADGSAVARKRRRNIHTTSEQQDAVKCAKMMNMAPTPVLSAPLVAAQPIVTVKKSTGAKRPQMKYDPDVPMTKEETSAWRREQRRKRNRESAAACRKRQRDRISELEGEVADWRAKFDDALNKLKAMDGSSAAELEAQLDTMFAIPTSQSGDAANRCSTPPVVNTSVTIPVSQGVGASHVVSPHDRPKFIPPLTISAVEEELHFLPVLEDPTIKVNDQGIISSCPIDTSRVENQQHLNEIITRPAVKITGAVTTPLDTIESVCDDLLQVVPDSCLSLTEKKTMPFPETCPSLVPTAAATALMGPATMAVDEVPAVTTDESDEDSDLGEFLLDAVQWL